MHDGADLSPPGDHKEILGRRILGSSSLLKVFSNFPSLSRGAKLCYLLMCAYGRDSGKCFTTARTLAGDLCCSVRQIERWWRALERAGFLRADWRAGRPTHYSFAPHPILERAAVPTPDRIVTPPLTTVSPTPDTGVTHKERTYVRNIRSSTAAKGFPGKVKAEIWGYMQGERKKKVAAPDRQIVEKCAQAMAGHSIEELRLVLRSLYRSGHRPGLAGGPRGYAWFVRVLENAFGPH